MLRYFTKLEFKFIIKKLNINGGYYFMKKHEIRAKFLEFKNSMGLNNFSSELSETEFNLLSIVTEARTY